MLPRRTLRATSRTAKKPANSLVNPWVSRMNSSAKQTSPKSAALAKSRRARPIFSLFGQALPDVLETVPDLPPPGRNMPSTAAIRQGGKLDRRQGAPPVLAPPLVELPDLSEWRVWQAFFTDPTRWKAGVNGVLLPIRRFHRIFPPRADHNPICK